MSALLIVNGRILTLAREDDGGSAVPRRGEAMSDLGVIERGWVRVREDRIEAVGSGDPPAAADGVAERVLDAEGRVVMPGLVDCHTHACWAGDRFDEFALKASGATYLQILESGGGIMSTVRAVRAASEDELVDRLLHRLEQMGRLGTSTVEVKSGYGLDTETELRMLEAVRRASVRTRLLLSPTFLGAHAIDRAQPDFVERTINETLPAVVERFPGIPCDAYCEEGAWSLADCRRLFEAAAALGCPIRVHTDQFHSLGMTRLAIEMGARSVDHLEATTPTDLQHLARSETIGVVLPSSGYSLDDRYAPARELVDAGAAVAVASNCNPGSAPSPSLPFAIHLAVTRTHLTPAEAIVAATWNAACVLGLQYEVGSIEPGKRADLAILDGTDERALAWEFACPGPWAVVIGGDAHELVSFDRGPYEDRPPSA